MQTENPAANLMQRLLQSDKIRDQYSLVLEIENGCTKILLRHVVDEGGKMVPSPYQGASFQSERIFFN
ncbi:MAG: hypothetical protein M3Q06_01090 [Bacteroidota bacterium]|nr:hypothetical protein [Bacteroidota bacterium]